MFRRSVGLERSAALLDFVERRVGGSTFSEFTSEKSFGTIADGTERCSRSRLNEKQGIARALNGVPGVTLLVAVVDDEILIDDDICSYFYAEALAKARCR